MQCALTQSYIHMLFTGKHKFSTWWIIEFTSFNWFVHTGLVWWSAEDVVLCRSRIIKRYTEWSIVDAGTIASRMNYSTIIFSHLQPRFLVGHTSPWTRTRSQRWKQPNVEPYCWIDQAPWYQSEYQAQLAKRCRSPMICTVEWLLGPSTLSNKTHLERSEPKQLLGANAPMLQCSNANHIVLPLLRYILRITLFIIFIRCRLQFSI